MMAVSFVTLICTVLGVHLFASQDILLLTVMASAAVTGVPYFIVHNAYPQTLKHAFMYGVLFTLLGVMNVFIVIQGLLWLGISYYWQNGLTSAATSIVLALMLLTSGAAYFVLNWHEKHDDGE